MLEIRTTDGSFVRIEGNALKALDVGLDELVRPLKQVYEDVLNDIKEDAQRQFPFDFRRTERNEMKPHAVDQFRVVTKKVIEGGRIILESSLHNDSQYAYMIKTATKFTSTTQSGSKVPLPQGTHVFSRLMWAPMRKGALKVARRSADVYVSILKRAA